MKIGAPKEIKDQEFRVSLTPGGAQALHRQGGAVLIEAGAGEGSGFSDGVYRRAGARIVSKRTLFQEADIVVKVKEPLASEYSLFRRGQTLFTYLHLAANRTLLDLLIHKEITAIAYETIASPTGARPLLKPMSEVAGRMAPLVGAFYLQKQYGGMGLLLSGTAGVPKANVTVIGGGAVGKNAAQVALGMGAAVAIVEESRPRRAALERFFRGRVATLPPDLDKIARRIEESALVIGAVARSADKAPHLVSRKMISRMMKGSVVVDVSIDQGGCFETSRPTSHSDPVYTIDDVVHYCVPNMPGVVPNTATLALTRATLPYLQKLAKWGLKEAVRRDPAFAKGVNTYLGQVVHPDIAKAFGLKVVALNL